MTGMHGGWFRDGVCFERLAQGSAQTLMGCPGVSPTSTCDVVLLLSSRSLSLFAYG